MSAILTSLIEPVGWVLLHFLWQAAAIALALWCFLWLARRRSPQIRYAAAGVAMLLMTGAAAITVWFQTAELAGTREAIAPYRVSSPVDSGRSASPGISSVSSVSGPAADRSLPPPAPLTPKLASESKDAAPVFASTHSDPAPAPGAAGRLRPLLPWMVCIWAAGVAFFSLRLLNGWRAAKRWCASGNEAVPDAWRQRFRVLCQRLRVTRPVRLLSSASLAVPLVIGWLKPVVLVPAGLFTGLGAAQLEALLAHELAHVRRHDYLVNLLQNLLETLFFYHPAVWWVSAQLRKEREHCCDDVATSISGGVLAYARALTALEEMRGVPAVLSVSASGGSLLQRIRRLAGVSEQRSPGIAWPLGILTLAAAAVALPITFLRAAGQEFKAPQAAHLSTEKHSAYCVHDGDTTHFILICNGTFSVESRSGADPKQRTWHDDGTLKFSAGGELVFRRTSEKPDTLSLMRTSPNGSTTLGTELDLARGRVFLLSPIGDWTRLPRSTPPVTTNAAMEALYYDIAAEVQSQESSAPAIRGFSLSGTASTTDTEHVEDLYEPDPAHPGKFRKKSRVFEMEITGEKDEPRVKYPANSGAFYIEYKDRTWGPIPGNPMEKLRLTELLTDQLFGSHVLKVTVWLKDMILLHDDALLTATATLVQQLIWYDHDILATLIEEELRTRPDSAAADAARAALAHIKSLTDAAKAKWEKLREKVPDEEYKKGRPLDAKDEAILWRDPNEVGLRLGLSGIANGAECQTGMNQDVKFYVRNDGKDAVPFSWNWGMNKGFRASLADAGRAKHLMLLHPGGGLVGLKRCRLEPGHVIELKSVQFMFSAPGTDQYSMSAFVVRPGHYTLEIENLIGNDSHELLKVGDVIKPGPEHVPGIGDWTGTLTSKPIQIAVPDANIVTAKPGDTFEPSRFARILFRKGLLNWNYREVLSNGVLSLWIEGGDWKTGTSDGEYRAAWDKEGDRIWYVDEKGIQCLKLGRDWGDLGHWTMDEATGDLGEMPDGVREALKLPGKKTAGNNPDIPAPLQTVTTEFRPVASDSKNFKSKHEETGALLNLWREEYRDSSVVPAEAMRRVAAQVKQYVERYPGEPAEKMKAQLPAMESDASWTWEAAGELLDSLCDAATAPVGWQELNEQFRSFNRVKPGQTWTEEQLAKLPFGDTDASGLRAAWIFEPMQNSYPVGTVLQCRILIHNNGKEGVEFRTDQWHQEDQWIVKNAAGVDLKVKTTRYTGLTPWQKVRLEPGQVYEAKAHGVGIGAGKYEESYSIGAIGAEIPAIPGDELTCRWAVKLDNGATRDPNWKPARRTPPASLVTGTVKFKVTAPDPNASPKIGIARGTGKYQLADGIKLQVSQVTRSEDGNGTIRTNRATIEWYAGNGQLGLQWPIELMPGLNIDTIIWMRGGTALWIVHDKAVRKIDFANAADVKEQNWKWESARDFGSAPPEVRAEIEKLRPKIAQVPPTSSILQFRLVAGPEEPDTEPMEPVENWSDLPTFHLRKTAILTAADVKLATAELDKASGRWQINLVFSEEGGARLAKATKEHLGRQLAIVGNGKVISAPVIHGEMDKQVTLSGNYLESEAKELVNAIQAAAPASRTADDPLTTSKMKTITVDNESHILLDGAPVSIKELEQKLQAHKAAHQDFPVVVRGDTSSAYHIIMDVIDVLGRLGITQVGLATKKKPADAAKPEAKFNPAAPAGAAAIAGRTWETVIDVSADGSISQGGKSMALDELRGRLAEIAKSNPHQTVIIRGDKGTDYLRVLEVFNLTIEAGLNSVRLATVTTAAGEKSQAAEKLLEESAQLSSAGRLDDARSKLKEVAPLLGKAGDAGFIAEIALLLADVEFALGRLDALQASQQDGETPEGKQSVARLIENALSRFTDGLELLLGYDKEYKKSVPCRSRLAHGFHELGRLFTRQNSFHDANVAYTQAAKVYTELTQDEPDNDVHRIALARCYNEVAELIRNTKPGASGAAEALQYQNYSVTFLRSLHETRPDDVAVRIFLATSSLLNGELLLARGDDAAARARFDEASILTSALLDGKDLSEADRNECESIDAKAKDCAKETGPAKSRSSFLPQRKPEGSDDATGHALEQKDGTRTEVKISGKDSEITELTYDKDGRIIMKRVFLTDSKGRVRRGIIYDGKQKPLGSIEFGYDKESTGPVEERHFNAKGKLIQRVFYPGTLKDEKYAGRFVSFRYDPANPRAAPVKETESVRSSLPEEPKLPSFDPLKHPWLKRENVRRTSFERKNDEIRESEYNAANELLSIKVIYLDSRGRHRQGVNYDGRMQPTGSILFGYDPTSAELNEERHFDKDGRLIRTVPANELRKPTDELRFTYEFEAFSHTFNEPAAQPAAGETPKPEATAEVQRLMALGQGAYDAKQFAKAHEAFEKALILDPANAEVRRMWLVSEAMNLRQQNPFAVPSHPDVLAEARKSSIFLTVLNADGRKPVADFRVIAGVRAGAGIGEGKDVVNWQPHTLKEGRNGGLMWPLDKAYDEMALRIEADGYAPQVFNWIEKKKGPQDLFFQMVEDKGIFCEVQTPDGQPAAGATVAVAMVQRDAVIEGGKLRHDGEAQPEKAADRWRWPRFIQVYAGGGFWLPPENDPTAAVLIVHDSGVLETKLADLQKSRSAKLLPWGRIDGKVLWRDKAGADQAVSLSIHRDAYGYPGVVAQYEKTKADAGGNFVFERVLPGLVQLSCPIKAGEGNKSGITEVNLTGQTTHLTVQSGVTPAVIGGQGRTVKGKLTGRDSWDGVTFHFHPTAPHVGFPGDDEMWKAWGEFQKSPSGPLFFRNGLKVNADGTFEIPGVLPADYQIFFSRSGEAGHIAGGKFSVEAEVPGQNAEPLTLPEMKASPPAVPSSEPDKKKTVDKAEDWWYPGSGAATIAAPRKFEDDHYTAWVITAFDGPSFTVLCFGKATASFGLSSFKHDFLTGTVTTAGGRRIAVQINSGDPRTVEIAGLIYDLSPRIPDVVPDQWNDRQRYSPVWAAIAFAPLRMRLFVFRDEGPPVQLGCEKLLQTADDLPEIVKAAEEGLTRKLTELKVPEISAFESIPFDRRRERLKVPLDDHPIRNE